MQIVEMQIVERGPVVVVGRAIEGAFDELPQLVPAAWERLWSEAHAITGALSSVFTEVSFSLGDGRYREVLGARVDPAAPTPPQFVRVELPAARYVHVARHEGVDTIAQTFGAMQEFAAANGLEPDGVLIDDGYTAAGDAAHVLHVRVRS